VQMTRRYYKSFSEASIKKAEDLTDTNGNNQCDVGESFWDKNNNNRWDSDGGNDGQGGAQDDVIYTVNVTYDRLFPIQNFIPNMGKKITVTAVTVLENQPYGDQSQYGAAVQKTCTAINQA
jgi:hypothetical protein